MAKAVIDIDVKDERFKELERRFERLSRDMKSSPQDFRNLGREFSDASKTLGSITKDITSWIGSLKAATIEMNNLAYASAGVGVGGGGGRGWGGGGRGRGGGGISMGALASMGWGRGGGGGMPPGGAGGAFNQGMPFGSIGGAVGAAASQSTAGVPMLGNIVSGTVTAAQIGGPIAGIAAAFMLVAKEVIGKGIEAAGTLLGQGDMFGINSFSTKMATERKYTTGLGVTTYGRTRAFQNVFGRVADAGSMLESSVQARTDPTSPAFQSYLMAGVNPYGGEPGDVGKQYLGRIREMARAFCHWIRASFFSSRKSYRL